MKKTLQITAAIALAMTLMVPTTTAASKKKNKTPPPPPPPAAPATPKPTTPKPTATTTTATTPKPDSPPPPGTHIYILDLGADGQKIAPPTGLGPLTAIVDAATETGPAIPSDVNIQFGPQPAKPYKLTVKNTGGWNGGESDDPATALTGSFIYANGANGIGTPIQFTLSGFKPTDEITIEALKGYQDGREPFITINLPNNAKPITGVSLDAKTFAKIGTLTGATSYEGKFENSEGGEADLSALRLTIKTAR